MKKLFALLLTTAMVGSLVACGSSDGASSGSGTGDKASEDTKYTVGICQLVQHDALDAATQGFKDALTDAEYVTVDLGWNNFGVFAFNAFTAIVLLS